MEISIDGGEELILLVEDTVSSGCLSRY